MNSQSESAFQDGRAYERFMGRWSRLTGRLFLDWLQMPFHMRWLDVGCGTGALTEAIAANCTPELIIAFDPSEQQIAYARSRIQDERITIKIGNATSIDARNHEFDVAASALVLNFIPDQRRAVSEMARVVRPGGAVAAYVWDFAGGRHVTQHLSEALAVVAPEAERAARAAQRADTTSREALSQLFQSAGLARVETRSLDIVIEFEDFDDYWDANTGLISPISVIGTAQGSLSPTQLDALKQSLRDSLRVSSNESIAFPARAWAVRGIVAS
jgi:ubiquinone/menaquinone biosynthesis C-methylase UbiE